MGALVIKLDGAGIFLAAFPCGVHGFQPRPRIDAEGMGIRARQLQVFREPVAEAQRQDVIGAAVDQRIHFVALAEMMPAESPGEFFLPFAVREGSLIPVIVNFEAAVGSRSFAPIAENAAAGERGAGVVAKSGQRVDGIVETAQVQRNLDFLPDDQRSPGEGTVRDHAVIGLGTVGQLAEADAQVLVIALRVDPVHHDGVLVLRRVAVLPAAVIETRLARPMLVDAHGRLDTEQDLVDVDPVVGSRRPRRNRRDGRRPVGPVDIAVADNAAQLHVVHLFFKRGDANAQAVQLVGELGGQLVHKGLVSAGRIFCHGPCDHLRHLITRDFLIAAIRAVAVALDHAVGGELRYGVVSPMVGGDVLEGIRGGKGRSR